MKSAMILATALVAFSAGTGLADDDCHAPMADWQPRDAVLQLADVNGWTVREFDIDDGCYEIEGRDRDGREIEVKLDPATLRVLEMEYEDEDGGRTRNAAPAGSVAPPQNGLFGNGAPPQVQVN